MKALLFGVLSWAMSGAIANLLVGAGLTLVVYSGVSGAVEALLSNAASLLGGLPADVMQLALLSGVGDALSILGSAILTRVTLVMASNIAGIKRAS